MSSSATPSWPESSLDEDEIDTRSYWTIPNAVSASRVLLVLPLIAAANSKNIGLVVALLVIIGVSDWADGVLARALHQISALGQIFDPICDRISIAGSLVVVTLAGFYPGRLAVALLVREAIISVATIVLAVAGWPRIKVTFLGKAATLMLMFSIPLFVVANSRWDSAGLARILAPGFGYAGLVAYYIALVQYAVAAWRLAPQRRKANLTAERESLAG